SELRQEQSSGRGTADHAERGGLHYRQRQHDAGTGELQQYSGYGREQRGAPEHVDGELLEHDRRPARGEVRHSREPLRKAFGFRLSAFGSRLSALGSRLSAAQAV